MKPSLRPVITSSTSRPFDNMQLTKAIVSFAVLALANASSVLGPRSLSGEATYYGGNLAGGACSFSTYTIPSSIFGTALSDSNWDTAANCGRCVSVTGPSGNVITAMVSLFQQYSSLMAADFLIRLLMNALDVDSITSISSQPLSRHLLLLASALLM